MYRKCPNSDHKNHQSAQTRFWDDVTREGSYSQKWLHWWTPKAIRQPDSRSLP